MSWKRKEREIINVLPEGALTVSEYAKRYGCSYTNVFKMEKKGKVRIVLYSGVCFVVEVLK